MSTNQIGLFPKSYTSPVSPDAFEKPSTRSSTKTNSTNDSGTDAAIIPKTPKRNKSTKKIQNVQNIPPVPSNQINYNQYENFNNKPQYEHSSSFGQTFSDINQALYELNGEFINEEQITNKNNNNNDDDSTDEEEEIDLDVINWSPEEVENFFLFRGFNKKVASKFSIHKITGPILLELQLSDLKEIEITTFGTRFEIFKEITALKDAMLSMNTHRTSSPNVTTTDHMSPNFRDNTHSAPLTQLPADNSPSSQIVWRRISQELDDLIQEKDSMTIYHPSPMTSQFTQEQISRSPPNSHVGHSRRRSRSLTGLVSQQGNTDNYFTQPKKATTFISRQPGSEPSVQNDLDYIEYPAEFEKQKVLERSRSASQAQKKSNQNFKPSNYQHNNLSNFNENGTTPLASYPETNGFQRDNYNVRPDFAFGSSHGPSSQNNTNNINNSPSSQPLFHNPAFQSPPKPNPETLKKLGKEFSDLKIKTNFHERLVSDDYHLRSNSNVQDSILKEFKELGFDGPSLNSEGRRASIISFSISKDLESDSTILKNEAQDYQEESLHSLSRQGSVSNTNIKTKGSRKFRRAVTEKHKSKDKKPKDKNKDKINSEKEKLGSKEKDEEDKEREFQLKKLQTASSTNLKALSKKVKSQTSAFQEGIREITPEAATKTADFSGWMNKRGNMKLGTWRSRFFILNGTRLSYFASMKDTREKGLIDIIGHRVMPAREDDKFVSLYAASVGQGRFCFKLIPPAPGFKKGVAFTAPKVHYFAVETQEEMRGWMAHLMKATIDIDDSVPVTSSCVTPTVPLKKAQDLLAKARENQKAREEAQHAQLSKGFHMNEYSSIGNSSFGTSLSPAGSTSVNSFQTHSTSSSSTSGPTPSSNFGHANTTSDFSNASLGGYFDSHTQPLASTTKLKPNLTKSESYNFEVTDPSMIQAGALGKRL